MNTEALIRSSRRTVLVVEDEAVNREMLGFILQDQYEVLFAGNGREALERLRVFDGTVAMILLAEGQRKANDFAYAPLRMTTMGCFFPWLLAFLQQIKLLNKK